MSTNPTLSELRQPIVDDKGFASQWFARRLNTWVKQLANLAAGKLVSPLTVSGLQIFANNAAALAGGLTSGQLYRTGGDPDTVAVVQ